MSLIDGTKIAARRREALSSKISDHVGLGIIVATDNPATHSYIKTKRDAAEAIGIEVTVKDLGDAATLNVLQEACQAFNQDANITGYIVQLPLPKGIDPLAVFEEVDPDKDADGLSPTNLGRLYTSRECIVPATPKGILTLLEEHEVPIEGATVAVVGKGLLTGLPIATLLSQRGATVTSCDKQTKDLAGHTQAADIVIVAAGAPGLITGEMVKDSAVVIDVGVTKLETRTVGDVDFASVEPKASLITPVPGGVGPMTVVSLLENVYELSLRQKSGQRQAD